MNIIMNNRNGFWTLVILIISVAVTTAVAFLILGPRPDGVEGSLDVSFLPLVNATLNTITTLLLLAGGVLIKLLLIQWHRRFMLTAFGSSVLFFVTYAIYHWYSSGPKPYTGEWSQVYYGILISHSILAVVLVPMVLITIYRGWTNQFVRHRKIAHVTFPLWFYVSVSGVAIYYMLYM